MFLLLCYTILVIKFAGVSELADETDSKSVIRKGVWVRVPLPAPFQKLTFLLVFFIVKQQGSREPTRCEASWKGGVLIAKKGMNQHTFLIYFTLFIFSLQAFSIKSSLSILSCSVFPIV